MVAEGQIMTGWQILAIRIICIPKNGLFCRDEKITQTLFGGVHFRCV